MVTHAIEKGGEILRNCILPVYELFVDCVCRHDKYKYVV